MDRQARKLASGQKGENDSEASDNGENNDKEKEDAEPKEDGQQVIDCV